ARQTQAKRFAIEINALSQVGHINVNEQVHRLSPFAESSSSRFHLTGCHSLLTSLSINASLERYSQAGWPLRHADSDAGMATHFPQRFCCYHSLTLVPITHTKKGHFHDRRASPRKLALTTYPLAAGRAGAAVRGQTL